MRVGLALGVAGGLGTYIHTHSAWQDDVENCYPEWCHMRFPQTPEAVTFDMDGLLLDTITLYFTAFSQVSSDLGHPISSAYLQSLIGLLGNELRQRLLQDFGPAFPVDALLETNRLYLSD